MIKLLDFILVEWDGLLFRHSNNFPLHKSSYVVCDGVSDLPLKARKELKYDLIETGFRPVGKWNETDLVLENYTIK